MRPFLMTACVFCTAALFFPGCSSTAPFRPLASTKSSVPIEGAACKVSRKPSIDLGLMGRTQSSVAYYGTLIRADAREVVLSVRMFEGRNAHSTWVPGLSRYFKNTGVGRTVREGEEISIPRSEVAELVRLDPREPEYSLATGVNAEMVSKMPAATGNDPVTALSSPPWPELAP